MHDIIVLKVIVRLLLPFILMFALYIQLHGELSPGGGFQAGVIFAAGFIAYSLVTDIASLKRIIPLFVVRLMAALGILIYGGVGVVAMLRGGRFLGYSVLNANFVVGQELGITLVEIGVGLTVFAVILLIFYSFGERSGSDA